MVSGQWLVVSGQWLVVSGQWSVKNGPLTTDYGLRTTDYFAFKLGEHLESMRRTFTVCMRLKN